MCNYSVYKVPKGYFCYMIKAKGRPLSPHLTIYKPQITSVMSIVNRITGVVFFMGLAIVLWTIILHLTSCDCVLTILRTASFTLIGKLMVFVWIYSMMIHTCGGIRYLFWSCGKGFELKQVETSGYAILIVAFVIALSVMLI